MNSSHESYCTFYLGDLYLGIDVLAVQEVIRPQPMTDVPMAPHAIRGLMNLRGQIVTGIDLRTQLQLAARPADETPMNVVVRTDDGPVSLLVDKIGDVLDVSGQDSEPPPETLAPQMRATVQHVFKLVDRLLLTLDVDKLLEPAGAL